MTAPDPFSHRTHTTTQREVGGKRVSVAKRKDEITDKINAWQAANPEVSTAFGKEQLAPARAFESVALIDKSPEAFEQMWVDRFATDPDLMWMLVGDIVRFVSADEIPRGTRTSSRRQTQDQHLNMQTVWRVLHGHYSSDPFPIAVGELIGQRSLTDFAHRCGFGSVTTLIRYQRGQRPLTMTCMEQMAKGGRVEPHYFLEYRAMWLGRELQRFMLQRPEASLKALKQIRDAVN